MECGLSGSLRRCGLVGADGPDGDSLRCRADATQHLVVPQAALAEALRGADATSLTVSVERVRRVPWSAPGLDGADLIVSVRDVVPARLP